MQTRNAPAAIASPRLLSLITFGGTAVLLGAIAVTLIIGDASAAHNAPGYEAESTPTSEEIQFFEGYSPPQKGFASPDPFVNHPRDARLYAGRIFTGDRLSPESADVVDLGGQGSWWIQFFEQNTTLPSVARRQSLPRKDTADRIAVLGNSAVERRPEYGLSVAETLIEEVSDGQRRARAASHSYPRMN